MHPQSDNYLTNMGMSKALHPDWGTTYGGEFWGIPFMVVSGQNMAKHSVAVTTPAKACRTVSDSG